MATKKQLGCGTHGENVHREDCQMCRQVHKASLEGMKLTAEQAIGVCLSVVMAHVPMDTCQQLAPKFIEHLAKLGYKVK